MKINGLQILSPHGDPTLPPKIVTAAQITGHYDLILLSGKSHTFSGAIDDLASAMAPETMILPVLNGIRHMDLCQRALESLPFLGHLPSGDRG